MRPPRPFVSNREIGRQFPTRQYLGRDVLASNTIDPRDVEPADCCSECHGIAAVGS